jgi:predicted HD phosphohydrolase
MLNALAQLRDDVRDVDQLHHSLQTATMAFRANASDEMVLCALCHDIGKYVGQTNHASVGAEIMKPYISEHSYLILKTHDVFQGYHVYGFLGKDRNARDSFKNEAWYQAAIQFSDEWDSRAFDKKYKVKSLNDFRPLIDRFFSKFRDPSVIKKAA